MTAKSQRAGAIATQRGENHLNGNGIAAALLRTFGPHSALRMHVPDAAGRLCTTLTHGSWPEEADALSVARRRPAFERGAEMEIGLPSPAGTVLLLRPIVTNGETVGIVEIIAPLATVTEHRDALPTFVESIAAEQGLGMRGEKLRSSNGTAGLQRARRTRRTGTPEDAASIDSHSNGHATKSLNGHGGSALRGIRVLIVDKQKLFGEALRSVLETLGAAVLQPVDDAVEALAAARRAHPDVVLIDLALNGTAMELAADIRRECPEARVIGLKELTSANGHGEVLRSGFNGCLTKDVSVEKLISSMRSALAGDVVLPSEPSRWCPPPRTAEERHATMLADHLTPREREVLEMLVKGMSSHDIAIRLSASKNTIRTHIQSILAKLQVHSRLQAATFAVQNGLVRVPGNALHPADDESPSSVRHRRDTSRAW